MLMGFSVIDFVHQNARIYIKEKCYLNEPKNVVPEESLVERTTKHTRSINMGGIKACIVVVVGNWRLYYGKCTMVLW